MGKVSDALRGIPLDVTKQRQVSALDEKFSKMAAEVERLKAQLLHLEAKVNPLEREVQRYKEEIKSDALKFDSDTGTHVDSSGSLRYCTKCLSDGKRSPLKTEQRGWRCMVCTAWYPNPNAPRPKVITDYDPYDSGGPQGWMR